MPANCCPTCKRRFVAKKSKKTGRTDEECVAGYDQLRPRLMERYGVPYRPLDPELFRYVPPEPCVECGARSGGFRAHGRCFECQAKQQRACCLCEQRAPLNEFNVCSTCVPRWNAINARAAEVAAANAGGVA